MKNVQSVRAAYRNKNRFRTELGMDLYLWAFRWLKKYTHHGGER